MNEVNNQNFKLVFNPSVARKLLKVYGCPIYDIKANKTNKQATVFVFEKTARFDKAMTEISTKHVDEDPQ